MIRVHGIDLAEGYWWSEVREGFQPEGFVCLRLWAGDEAKTKAYEAATSILAEIIGLPQVQIMERLWTRLKTPSPSLWYKEIATAWFDRTLVEGLEK